MKRSTTFKLTSFLCLGLILIGYNQCLAPMQGTTKSPMKFSSKESSSGTGREPSSGSTLSTSEVKAISIEAFKTTVYPITRARCIACHGTTQTPLHASANVETAHNVLVDNFKIDFNNMASSRMVLKLKNDRHNCWGDCSQNATAMLEAITEWKRLIDEKAPDAMESTGNVTGKTTAETNTVATLLSPENLIDQGTITLMAESGSLRTPMVKGNDNGTSYIWAPEGTGIKTLTSADAGLAYVNFKVTSSDFYKVFMLVNAPDAMESTGNVTGKTTAETNTVATLLSPENLIDQGTITLMAESGSLRTPMVKGNDNGTSYIWAPEGTGIKTLTSADAGLAYVNFKVTSSDFYKVFMLVNAPDANSDSAFIKVAGSDTKEWHIRGLTKGFEWREVTHSTAYQDSPFYIAGGANFGVEIRQRDDGLKISKITITNDPSFDPTATKALKSTISLPIATLSGVSGAMFDIDIEEYDMYSYKLTNPRIRTTQDLYVKSLKVLVNGSYNPQHATYTIVNKKVTPLDGALSNYSMILLKDRGSDSDRLSFSFDHIATTEAPVTTAPVSGTTPTTVTKISSVDGFKQTLWPVLRARCIGCHGDSQPPLHSHANVTTAHTNVIESALVNFTNVGSSKLSTKLKTNRHNCWSDCNSNAAEIEGQITIWKNLSGK